jgi:hypothetical protein
MSVAGAITGSITPAPAPDSPDPISVAIGGVDCLDTIRRPGAGEIAGLIQVNAVVPDNAPTGPAIPIVPPYDHGDNLHPGRRLSCSLFFSGSRIITAAVRNASAVP